MEKKFEATAALVRFYKTAWEKGIWIQEYGVDSDGRCIALAGTIKKLEELERKLGKEIDWSEFKYGDGIEVGAEVGLGKSRFAACRQAIKAIFAKISKEVN